MSNKCCYCVNKTQCSECDTNWKDKFIPSDEVKQYFHKNYCGVGGIDGCTYGPDPTDPSLVPTHHIIIDGEYYCPYCGEKMFLIQNKITFGEIGHYCICKGARDELEYETKKAALIAKHENELAELKKEYKEKLSFCSEKLLEIKQEKERKNFKFFSPEFNHFGPFQDAKKMFD